MPSLSYLLRLLPALLLFFIATPSTHPIASSTISVLLHTLNPPPPNPPQPPDLDLGLLSLSRESPRQLRRSLLVAPGASLLTRLAVTKDTACSEAAPCQILVESWYAGNLFRERKPDPYLLARRNGVPDPFPPHSLRAVDGNAARFRSVIVHGESGSHERREKVAVASRRTVVPKGKGKQSRNKEGTLADAEAFLTWRPYQYLILPNVTRANEWHVRVLNHNGTVMNRMNATFRVTLRLGEKAGGRERTSSLCPRGPTKVACEGNGKCVDGRCKCDIGHGGRFCESVVRNFTRSIVEIPSEQMLYYRYVAPRNGSVAVTLRVLAPAARSAGAQPILFAKRLGENGGRMLREGPPLPTTYDLLFTDKSAFLGQLPVQRVVRTHLVEGEHLYIGVYNFHRLPPVWILRQHPNLGAAGLLAPHSTVSVKLDAYPCLNRRRRQHWDAVEEKDEERRLAYCPPMSGHAQWELSVTFLLLPFLLGTLTLLTMVVCVSVWASVFRQRFFTVLHGQPIDEGGGTPRQRDKLSEAEVNSMFPAFEFTKVETAALGATGDVCCSVCLCSFEEGEYLRRLACGHSYHSSCLDQWLVTNATCPRCRKSARIQGEARSLSWLTRRLPRISWGRASLRALAPSFMVNMMGRGRQGRGAEDVDVNELLAESDFSRELGP